MPLTAYALDMPCKGYIRKYYNCLYGDPVLLNHSSDFGDTILTKMASTPLSQVNKKILNISTRDYNATIRFQLPVDTLYRINTELSDQQVYSINRYLENVFETDLCIIVSVASVFGVEKKQAIERFANKFGIQIEEDVTYEALQKKEYRFRKSSTAKNMFLVQMSSPFSVFKRSA
ncbi:MAG: hypothetical protein ACTHKV_03470 [Flavipsychrobacter sp.]